MSPFAPEEGSTSYWVAGTGDEREEETEVAPFFFCFIFFQQHNLLMLPKQASPSGFGLQNSLLPAQLKLFSWYYNRMSTNNTVTVCP